MKHPFSFEKRYKSIMKHPFSFLKRYQFLTKIKLTDYTMNNLTHTSITRHAGRAGEYFESMSSESRTFGNGFTHHAIRRQMLNSATANIFLGTLLD
ncbi:unnamed protein product [Trifolium pratense]|uniref:Uncharacterized protein n=1 Tax=Trifolium pratense TaxID=57577 RepID=A0ACB0JN84_TRIPR|nr:unnamed protein product [Trifolium pratense]